MIDEVDRRLIQLEMEKLSLRKETRADALKRIEQIDDEMTELQEKQVSVVFWDLSVLLWLYFPANVYSWYNEHEYLFGGRIFTVFSSCT